MNVLEFYTLGSKSELEGLTLMVREVNQETGEPTIQLGSPDTWYKAKKISEEEYSELKKQIDNPTIPKGIAGGLIDDEGLRLNLDMEAEIAATKRVEDEQVSDFYEKNIRGMLDNSELDESMLSTYIRNVPIPNGTRSVLIEKMLDVIPVEEQPSWNASRNDKASIWAVLNSSEDELSNGGTLPEDATLPNNEFIGAGNFGNIQAKARKVEVMGWFNLASEFSSNMTDKEYAVKIIELRSELKFIGIR